MPSRNLDTRILIQQRLCLRINGRWKGRLAEDVFSASRMKMEDQNRGQRTSRVGIATFERRFGSRGRCLEWGVRERERRLGNGELGGRERGWEPRWECWGVRRDLGRRNVSKWLQNFRESKCTVHREKHCNAVEPTCHEADCDCSHNRNWDISFWEQDFFRHLEEVSACFHAKIKIKDREDYVGRAVQTCECPIRVDESYDECYSVWRPPGIIHKVCEYKTSSFVCRCSGRNSD